MKHQHDFRDKVVLITGAARGIGAEAARQFGAAGARLVLLDIDGDGAARAADGLSQDGVRAIGLACDITSAAQIGEAHAQAIGCFGRIDILINNAAAQQFGAGTVDTPDLERYRLSFEVNLLGCIRMVDAVLPAMRARGTGHIVNTSSSLAIRPNPVIRHLMPYVASKGAVLTWTYALACALRGHGIAVSLFCPGLTATTADGLTVPQRKGWFSHTPPMLAAPGRVQDCAAALLGGVAQRRFLIASEPDHADALASFAAAGLDPAHFSL